MGNPVPMREIGDRSGPTGDYQMINSRKTHASLFTIALLLLLVSCSHGCAVLRPAFLRHVLPADPADSEAGQWDLVNLDLDVKLHPFWGALNGSGVARLKLRHAASVGPTLELGAASHFVSVESRGGAKASIDLSGQLARIRFTEKQPEGTEVEVGFRFANRGNSFQLVVDARCCLASWARGWYPSPLGGSAAAPGTTRLLIPKKWSSVSNGALQETVMEGNRKVETWVAQYPMARSFAAGPYVVQQREVGDRAIRTYFLPRHADKASAYAEAMSGALRAQEKYFGTYPYPSYAIVEIPNWLVWWGGSSEQGFFMAVSNTFDVDGVNLPLISHELAHGWWGNYVRSKQPSALMVSEALAQYGAVLAIAEAEGTDEATKFLKYSRRGYNGYQCAYGYFNYLASKGHDKPLMELTGGPLNQDHNLSDAKGHWVYHMLRHRIGDELFISVLQQLVDTYGGQRMSLQDLRDAYIKSAPPQAALDQFFEQWLDRVGTPSLHHEWRVDHGQTHVVIKQQGRPYDLWLDIGIETEQASELHRLRITEEKHEFTFPGEAKQVRLDPNDKLLIFKPDYER